MNYRDKIRKYIECPEFGNSSYGAWGSLRIDQRRNIKRLLDELDGADDYIKKLYKENTTLVNEITVLKKENQKLKEMQCTFLGTGCQNKIKEYKIQQREFIDWLEIRIKDRDKVRKMYELYSLSEERLSSQYFVLQDVLLKYKEIIGGKN